MTRIVGNLVTLRVIHVYRGPSTDEVQVPQEPGSSEQMSGSGRFELAGDYLVASSEGGILVCGYSGEAGIAPLQELYAQAF